MYDIFFISSTKNEYFFRLKEKFPLIKHSTSFQLAQDRCLTEFFWIVWDDIIVNKDFNFDYIPDEWSRDIVHVFKNKDTYDGIALIPKKSNTSIKEIEHRFYLNKKEVDIQASNPKPYDVFKIDSYDEYLNALANSTTNMFWMTSANLTATIPDVYFDHYNDYDRKQNHAFVHQVGDQSLYNGVFLCSKHQLLTKREIEHRHPVNRKEWDTVASGPVEYDVFEIDSYDEYLTALEASRTEMFWMTSRNLTASIPDVYFDHYNDYDRKQNHAFVHQVGDQQLYNGVFLCSTHQPLTEREIIHRHIVNRKEWDIVASGPVEYDVFKIDSYEEYLTALKTSKTEMFWMTSANITATIPNVYFDHYNDYDRKQNHAFVHQVGDQSLYNGVFLCSKHQLLTEREIIHRHLVNRKEWDIVASGPVKYDVFEIDSYDEYLTALEASTTEMFWMTSRNLTTDLPDVYFDHYNDYDRKQNHAFVHQVGDQSLYNGVFLCSTHQPLTEREIIHRHIVNRKEWDIVASGPVEYDVFEIDSYDEYLTALEASTTEMFWMTSANITATIPNVYFDHYNDYDRKQNHAFVHQVGDQQLYNGVFLCSKHQPLTEREITHRHIVNRKEWDTVASGPVEYDVFEIDSYDEYLTALNNSKTEMFWMTGRNITATMPSVYFDHYNDYDRKQNHAFVHQVGDQSLYNGVFLCSVHTPLTEREITHRHPVNRKEWDTVASTPVKYDVFEIDSYDEYLTAMESSKTEMFWMTSANITTTIPDVYFDHSNTYDREQNHAFVHQVGDQSLYNGVFLCSKHQPLTEREITHRHPVDRKEWDTVASGPVKYDVFEIDSYDEYLTALETSKTEMFWIIPDYVSAFTQFKFDTYFSHHQTYERTINHAYLNGKYHDGIILCSKYAKFSKREFDFRFIAHKIESPVIISTPKPYDVVFISYEEPNADDNYKKLLKKIPTAKRIHGVKGIHQAHIAAAGLSTTDMFWIVDGDAQLTDEFEFDYQVAKWDQETVHVWRSQNPINDLVYGYGGIKLFPRTLTIDMDTNNPDMTTSISSKFKAIDQISNITAFNTDPYNTWKSAFRECVKLSSRVINRQKDDETHCRLQIWCTVGADKPCGKYAIAGANTGAEYGKKNQNNKDALQRINDFDWLREQFDKCKI